MNNKLPHGAEVSPKDMALLIEQWMAGAMPKHYAEFVAKLPATNRKELREMLANKGSVGSSPAGDDRVL